MTLRVQWVAKWARHGLRLAGLVLALGMAGSSFGDDPLDDPNPLPTGIIDDFESARPSWREEQTDTTFVLRGHDRSPDQAHQGRLSERFEFEAGPGSVLYYSYAIPRIPLTPELAASLYVRSNRTGPRLYARVVLPQDQDPDTGQPAFLLIAGTSVDTPDRWQRLQVGDLPVEVERQARVMRAGSQRTVNLQGAYLDRIVVNLYGGAGNSLVFLDDLQVSPVPAELVELPAEADPGPGEGSPNVVSAPRNRAADRVQLNGNVLQRDGRPWFPRGISAPGADLASIRRAGFDLLELPIDSDADLVQKADELGYMVMPRLSDVIEDDETEILAAASAFPGRNSVAFWNLGSDLGRPDRRELRKQQLEAIRRRALAVKRSNELGAHLSFGTVVDQLPQYALFGRNLDIIGIELPAFGGALDPLDFYRDLRHARQSTATRNPNAVFWAWIPASAYPVIRQSVWGEDVPPGWGWPAVQPDQLRMLTYAALMAGYHGVGYRADAELGRPGGLARLYEMTLLIAEIELLESMLAAAPEPPGQWSAYPPEAKLKLTYNPNAGTMGGGATRFQTPIQKEMVAYSTIRVASFDSPDHRTKVLLVADLAPGGQWAPTQMGYRDLNLLIPAPESAMAFEVSLGDVQALESHRDTGGRRVTIPIFNGTAIVVLTTDQNLLEQYRAQVNSLRPRAADIAIKLAELQHQEISALNGKMAVQGVTVRNAGDLLDEAGRMIVSARDSLERQDYAAAWIEARSVGQPLRMVSRAYFDRAFREFLMAIETADKADGRPLKRPKTLALPIGCPPLVSVQTLPQYTYWLPFIRGDNGAFGANRLESGGFDVSPADLRAEGWADASHPVDGFETTISIDRRQGVGSRKSALKLAVEPANRPDPESFRRADGKLDKKAYERASQEAIDQLSPIHLMPLAAVRTPPLPVRERDFIRVRVYVKMPRLQAPGSAGLIVRDNLGGEQLQFSSWAGQPAWRELVLFRRAPADGDFQITLGLAGTGEAFFDDLRIEVLGDPDQYPPDPLDRADEPLARRPDLPDPRMPGESPVEADPAPMRR